MQHEERVRHHRAHAVRVEPRVPLELPALRAQVAEQLHLALGLADIARLEQGDDAAPAQAQQLVDGVR